jgi:pSer/pThr/pTyr-binding forkhead associated (FHA) protein
MDDVRLIVINGPSNIPVVRLRRPEALVGRQRGCDIRIPSEEVSRRHCLLAFSDGELSVEDLSSVNGTFLNGRRVVGKQAVEPGDQLQIGPVTFRVDYAVESPVNDVVRDSPNPVPASAEPESEAFYGFADERGRKPARPSPAAPAPGTAANFDFGELSNLPQGDDFRDLLRKMDR